VVHLTDATLRTLSRRSGAAAYLIEAGKLLDEIADMLTLCGGSFWATIGSGGSPQRD
jgi:hypothetical protein